MKKTLFAFSLLAMSFSAFGQSDSIMLADYETNSQYPDRTYGWTTDNVSIVSNPIIDATNGSAKVGALHIKTQWSDGVNILNFDEPISLGVYPIVKVKILSDSSVSKVATVSVKDINDYSQSVNVTLPANINAAWTDAVFDFSSIALNTPISFIKEMSIRFDYGNATPENNQHNIYYFDDFRFTGPSLTITESDEVIAFKEDFSENGWWAPKKLTLAECRTAAWGGSVLTAPEKHYVASDSISMGTEYAPDWSWAHAFAELYPSSVRSTLSSLTIKEIGIGGLQNLAINYAFKWTSAPASFSDAPTIEYSTDGTTWVAATTSSTLPSVTNTWAARVTHALSSADGNSNMLIRITNNATGIFVMDSIKVYGNPAFADSVIVAGTGNVIEITTDNGTLQMVDTILPLNAAQNVLWSVVNGTGKAEINASGLLTAIIDGTVTVKARAKDIWGTKIGEKVITLSNQVYYVDSIAIKGKGDVYVIDEPGDTLKIVTEVYPEAAHNKTIKLSYRTIGDTAAVFVKDSMLIPYRDGQIYIIAEATDGSGRKDSTLFTISNQVPLTGIAFDKEVDSIKTAFGSLQLNVVYTPDTASNKSVKYSIISGGDANTASVDINGIVTAKANGTVSVRVVAAANASLADTIQIVIVNQPSIAFDKEVDSIKTAFGSLQLNVIFEPDTTSNKAVYYSVISGADFASLNNEGIVTAKANGTVSVRVVSAVYAILADTIQIVVVNQPTWKEFDVATIVDGTNITSSSDFSSTGKIAWDSKYIFLQLDVTDDSIYAEGNENTWMLDNIEIYFDMNNVKTPAYPRGQSVSPAYIGEPGCHQLRLIPGRTFNEVNGTTRTGWCIEQYKVTETGYQFVAKFVIDSLLKGYVPEVGKEIGFDVLASDNDNAPFYRDQVSFHSPSGTIWCDAAMWGTVAFAENGSFDVIPDLTAPSEVTNLVATQGDLNALLTWDAATDNIVVEKYFIFINDVEDTAIYAKLTDNTYSVNDVTPGVEYTFSVVAEDIDGNRSDKVSTTFTYISGVNNTEMCNLNIYPNPASSFISLNNESPVYMEVYTTTGQLVIQKTVNAGEKVDISALNNGVYSIRITENNNTFVLQLSKK